VGVVFIATTAILIAGGYQIGEHGARAMGMGGAFAAQARDASAIYFNPAGLAFQKGINILAGTTLIMPATTFTGPSPATTETKMESQVFYPSNFYATYAMDDALVFGLGVFNPFGLGTKWPAGWVGRNLSLQSDLMTFYINPTVAYKISDQLSIGVGVSYVIGSVELKQNTGTAALGAPNGELALDGSGSGINFNFGLLYKPMPELSVGVSYRHLTDLEFEGDAVFSNMAGVATYFPGGTGKATLPMPADLKAGVAYDVSRDLTVEVDFQYVFWKEYDVLKLDIPVGPVFPLLGTPLQGPVTSEKKWENSILLRLGGEYRMDKLALRAGVVYDQTPQPDKSVEPMLPDANRIEGVIGAGYAISDGVMIHAAFQYINSLEREVKAPENIFPGKYKSTAMLFGLNLELAL
jgi:long-chain fatty acid transport protein